MQSITITGYLGTDPKITNDESIVFPVAVKQWRRDPIAGVRTETVTWYTVVALGNALADTASLDLKKGDLVEIYGDPFSAQPLQPTEKIPHWRSRIGIYIEHIHKWAKADTFEHLAPGMTHPPLRWDDPVKDTDF